MAKVVSNANAVERSVVAVVRRIASLPAAGRWLVVVSIGAAGLTLSWWAGPAVSMILVFSLATALAAWVFPSRWPAVVVAIGIAAGSGVIAARSRSSPFSGAEVWLNAGVRAGSLLLLGLIVSAFRRHLDETERAAMVDGLTGVASRRAILQELDVALTAVDRNGRPISIVYFDLDDLKSVNDRQGHDAGDELIKGFASAVRSRVRPDDRLGRVGGDEFLLVCRDTTAAGAEALVKRVVDGDSPLPASWGIATTGVACQASTLMAEADLRMYEHKQRRRTRPESGPGVVPEPA